MVPGAIEAGGTAAGGLAQLCERLGHAFRDPGLLETALTHTSFANENPQAAAQHNERLEFLGDAVLDFVVSDLLMARFPEMPEGELSKLRAALVTEAALAELARELALGPLLRVGRGEALSGGHEKDSLLADALEAVLAAVYLDSAPEHGAAVIQRVVRALFEPRLHSAGRPQRLPDFKTELQELVQSRFKDTVRYTIVNEAGLEHEKQFEAAVMFQGRELGRGSGRSKKHAEQEAARLALQGVLAAETPGAKRVRR